VSGERQEVAREGDNGEDIGGGGKGAGGGIAYRFEHRLPGDSAPPSGLEWR
jgi:hypothetical protein